MFLVFRKLNLLKDITMLKNQFDIKFLSLAVSLFAMLNVFFIVSTGYAYTIDDIAFDVENKNLIIESNRINLEQFQNDITIAKLNKNPIISLSGYAKTKYQDDDGDDDTIYPRSFGLSITKNIFDGYKSEFSILKADELYQQALLNFETIKQDIYLEALNSYSDILEHKKSLKIYLENLSLSQNYINFKSKEYDLGMIDEITYEQALIDHEKIKNNIEKVRIDIENEKINFSNYSDYDIDGNSEFLISNLLMENTPDPYIRYAINNKPSLLSKRRYLKILEYDLSIQKSVNMPKLDLEVDLTKNWDLTATSDELNEYSIMGKIEIPLYDSGIDKIKENNISVDILQNTAQLKNDISLIENEIKGIFNDISLLNRQLKLENKQKEINKRKLLLNEKNYESGKITESELISDQIDYNNQLVNIIISKNQLQKAHFLLLNRLGDVRSDIGSF